MSWLVKASLLCGVLPVDRRFLFRRFEVSIPSQRVKNPKTPSLFSWVHKPEPSRGEIWIESGIKSRVANRLESAT